MDANDLLRDIRRSARFLSRLSDPGFGDYNLDDALRCACGLAADCLAIDRALSAGVPLPDAWTKTRGIEQLRPAIPIDSFIAAVEYLDEQERSDFRATPAADRPQHIYRHVLELRRWLGRYRRARSRQPDDQLLRTAQRRALDAALLLVAAYRNGRLDGGYVEWSDLDAAHEVAREAAVLAARHRRQRRRAERRSPG